MDLNPSCGTRFPSAFPTCRELPRRRTPGDVRVARERHAPAPLREALHQAPREEVVVVARERQAEQERRDLGLALGAVDDFCAPVSFCKRNTPK